ncbi:phosphomevalonate kinase [Actinoplanes campanulatus]|uniref:phosphomevalonate kinase n=1 Tax=Actinoplanes campanulatus TaxID=113559 RepID=A0A7W5FFZ7_9ACTN|nr:phosphomevalonate kinase [Actinoplanes campanulatus]MBB3096912.1 phosphomevalonate kinase [Actinoplanes campanulatus]GGN44856.1 phosphomevalonate kinase [Actinoplanes campanulatus]GID37455.1 phosphomevalonate kinase [Actinoplanes campanulatus]
MSGPPPVRSDAPGKLFVAGEYAVMEPGHPAILIAVDRQVSVTVSTPDGADVVIDSDLNPAETRLERRGGDLVAAGADAGKAPEGLGHVLSAIGVVGELLTERGSRMPAVHLSIRSRLHRDGLKFGLGSSGAVTVAVVTAVASYCGVELSPEQRYRLAMLATARHDAGSSGGDLAASVWGGWLAYHAPDRAVVLDLADRRGVGEMLRSPWPGFSVRRLEPPRGLALEVGWTGEPASTFSLAQRLGSRAWRGSAAQRGFLARSDECVRAAMGALDRGDDRELLEHIRAARRVLADLDDEVRLGIFTPRLTALCDAADAVGGAAKPSGAGGGDCGIALLDAAAKRDISQLRKEWVAAGVLPMPIHVQPTKGSPE